MDGENTRLALHSVHTFSTKDPSTPIPNPGCTNDSSTGSDGGGGSSGSSGGGDSGGGGGGDGGGSEDAAALSAALTLPEWMCYYPPGSHEDPKVVDRCWCHDPVASANDGKVTIVLHNMQTQAGAGSGTGSSSSADTGLGIYFRYPKEGMEQLTQWSHMIAGEYICGIEPGNATMLGRKWTRENGTLEMLPPGGKRTFELEIGVTQGKDLEHAVAVASSWKPGAHAAEW